MHAVAIVPDRLRQSPRRRSAHRRATAARPRCSRTCATARSATSRRRSACPDAGRVYGDRGRRRQQGRLHRLLLRPADAPGVLALSDGRGRFTHRARRCTGSTVSRRAVRRLRQRRPARSRRAGAVRTAAGVAQCRHGGWRDVSAAAVQPRWRRLAMPLRRSASRPAISMATATPISSSSDAGQRSRCRCATTAAIASVAVASR